MKNNPRPIIEWLNELPELIRELVIADYKDAYGKGHLKHYPREQMPSITNKTT